jgi:hypothetical protein
MKFLDNLWTTMFNLFDPFMPVSGDHIKAWFVEREHSPLPRLELALRPGRREQKVLLAGQRGCGKTSELFRLMSQMKGDYYTIYTDLFAAASQETISAVEVFFSLGAAIYKVAQADGLQPKRDNWEKLVSSLSTLARESSRMIDPLAPLSSVLATSAATYPLVAPLAKAGETLLSGLKISRKDIEKIELEPVLREVVARVNVILSDVESKAEKPVLLVADGLDKIRRLELATALFNQHWAFTMLPCQAIYVVPPILYYSVRFQEIGDYFNCEELPNVRLHHRQERESKVEDGWRTMRDVVDKRLRTVTLDGTSHVFTDEALKLLIEKSGGVMRDMIELIRNASMEAELLQTDRIEFQAAQQAVANMRRKIQAGLFKKDYEALLAVQQAGGMPDKTDETQMELLRANLIVNYKNGGFWRDIHPLVVDILQDYTE